MNNSLKEYFASLPEVKRIHELEPYIDGNSTIKRLFQEIKDLQKKMVSSKEFHQKNQYESYVREYNKKKEELLDYPFVEEYLELLEYVHKLLEDMTSTIEASIDKIINE